MSKSEFSPPEAAEEKDVWSVSFAPDRVAARLALFDQVREAERQKRKAGRPEGKLSDGLREKLENCNVAQLEKVRILCKRLVARQRNPPLEYDCPNQFAVKVIASFGYRNKLYRAELKRTTKRAEKVYVNGPYVYAYRWDGAYVRPEYFGSKNLSKKLPRKVWAALKNGVSGPDIEKLKLQLSEKLSQE